MKKRYISLVLNIILAITLISIFGPREMNLIGAIGMILFFIAIAVAIIDVCMIISFCDETNYRKVILNYSDYKKYLSINPKRYDVQYYWKAIYLDGDHFKYIDTVIFFDHVISNIRYILNKSGSFSDQYMKRYLESVSKDIEIRRKESEKQIEEALKSQKVILSRMEKENELNGITETLQI